MKRILAIDPGLSGGLAHYGPSGVTLDAMPATDADVRDLVLDRLGDDRHACWGGGVTIAAQAAGAAGAGAWAVCAW